MSSPQTNDLSQPPSGGISPSTLSVTNSPEFSVFSTTNMDYDGGPNYPIVNRRHGHLTQPRHDKTPPSLTSSRSLPLPSIRYDMDRGEGPSYVASVHASTNVAESAHDHESTADGVIDPSISTTRAIDPPTTLKRGRKRNKSPTRNANPVGDPQAAASSPSTHGATSTVGQPQPPPLSTQTQLASLRGALEAARLREEKTRHEIERLRWETQLAKSRETEYHAYTNYLTHQLHSYASFVATMQAPERQLHQPSGSYSNHIHPVHSHSATIRSMSISGLSSATDQHPLPTNSETSQSHGSPSSVNIMNDQSHPTPVSTTPITSLPSPSGTASTLPSSRLHTHPQAYTNSYTVKPKESMFTLESPTRQFFINPPSSSHSPQVPLLSPASAPNSHNSPVPPQSSFVFPPLGNEVTTANSLANFDPVNYYPGPLFHGSINSAMAFAPAYATTFCEPGSGKSKVRSKAKGSTNLKDKRENDRVSIKDEGAEEMQNTTSNTSTGEVSMPTTSETFQCITSRPPSPTVSITQFDTSSLRSCKRDPSDCSSSPSSSLPSTPSSRSRSHHSPRSDQLSKTLMSESLPPMTPQSYSPLEMLGLNMEQVRDSSRGRIKSSFVQSAQPPSHFSYYDHHNKEYYTAAINDSGREDGDGLIPASGHRIYGLPNRCYRSGLSNEDEGLSYDNEGDPLNGMLADAILKRPEAIRMGSASRISEGRLEREQLNEAGVETMKESEKVVSVVEEEARNLPADPVLEFTFPSLSNWGSVLPAKTTRHEV